LSKEERLAFSPAFGATATGSASDGTMIAGEDFSTVIELIVNFVPLDTL